ncbi:MAG: RDD family protein [Moraxellaceae bacterium]|nr:RDD family protein [Pseudobdellovibrionaceae bacterium]
MKNFDSDVMDEFEFKPLTAGLGFHKKNEIKVTFTNPNSNFQPQINVPMIEDDSILKAQSAVNEILKNLNHKKQLESLQKTKYKFEWKSTAPSMAAATLDTMFVAALFLVCMICMLTITKIDLLANLSNPGENSAIFVATGALMLMVSFVYMTLFRTYMGFTPGEWAFDQRCGKEIDQASSNYVPKVILRSLLVSLTGFIPLTIISLFLKFDLAGTLINLPLQKRAS